MTGNGADIDCYADRENQPVQMAVRFWITRNSQLQAIQRAGITPPKYVLLFGSRSMPSRTSRGFSAHHQCIQVTAFHKMVNINSRAAQEIDFQRLFFIADPGSGRCGSSDLFDCLLNEYTPLIFHTGFSQLLVDCRTFFGINMAITFSGKTSARIKRSVRSSSGVLCAPNCGSS